MSRTYKTRPRWVKLNDPKFPTKERHQHHRIMREPTGQMEEITRHRWTGDIFNMEPYTVMVPEYRVWVENIDCTINVPEVPYQHWRYNKVKLCDKRPLYENGCPCCSKVGAKKLYNKAQRASINQQLHNAVRDYGKNADTDPASCIVWPNGIDDGTVVDNSNWWDVDITTAQVADDWDSWE